MIYYKDNIEKIYCCGYDIEKVVACGNVAWVKQEPTPPEPPSDYKLKMWFDDGSIGYILCNSTSSITYSEVQTAHTVDGVSKSYTAITAVSVGSCVSQIDNGAFSGMTNLERVQNYGENVERIGANAFSGCTSLWGIFIPCNCKTIGANAFNGCWQVQQLNICSGVETIYQNAFRGLSSYAGVVSVPASVSSIGNYAFYGMSNVSRFEIHPTSPPTLNNNNKVFNLTLNTVTSAPIKVKTLSTYKIASGWVEYAQYLSQL